jgi:hypothetical protein
MLKTILTKTVLLWTLAGSSAISFGVWRYFSPVLPGARVALLYDRSKSAPPGCDSVVALAQRALTLPDLRPGSTLTFFATGTSVTSLEPSLVRMYPLPVGRLATEAPRRLRERQDTFAKDLRGRCMSLPRASISPLFRAVKEIIAQLRAGGSNKPTALYLLVRSDLRETADPAIKRALSKSSATRRALIDNHGVHISFCGLAETLGSRSDASSGVDHIQAVWTTLFTDPELVTFEPYCPTTPEAR